MLFTELRASIVARLRRAMPKEVRVLPHPGPLDEEELARICFGDPSLLVAVLGVNGVDRNRGHSAAELRLGVYVACGPGKGAIPADTAALAIIPRTLAAIYGENWDMENVESRPEDIRAEKLYSGKIGAGLLVALWGISWKQRVILPELHTFEPPSSYPSNPDGTPNLDAEDVPFPWNDPLGEFLRLGLTIKTEPDASGQSQTYSDDIVAVRGEDNG